MTINQSRIIGTVLSPACRVWLRSQVERVENLQVNIAGGDRQILGGYIPRITISAKRAIYRGLHLSQIQLVGENIRINLGQVLKGKPLRLTEPILVAAELLLEEPDLKASLASHLLSTALTDLLQMLLKSAGVVNAADFLGERAIDWQQVTIDGDRLSLAGVIADAQGKAIPVAIRTGIKLASPTVLRLDPLDIQHSELAIANLDSFEVDLGSEVELEELTLMSGQLVGRGRLKVIP